MQQRNNKNRMQRNNNNNKHRHGGGRNNHQNRGGQGGQQNRPRININQVTNLRDKFLNQARDALHNGDRVQSEYYLQHADHYQRLINEYNEEQESRRQQMPDSQMPEEGENAAEGEAVMTDGEVDDLSAENRRNTGRRHHRPQEEPQPMAQILPPSIPLDTDDLAADAG
jgi:hypothetical protein